MIDYGSLIKAGVHFGHQTSRWCPLMARYIWGHKNKVHLIDVSKTAQQLEKAAQFLKEVTASGKSILWVGTKKPAQKIMTETAQDLNMPHVSHRWIGGSLSNFLQVKKSITKLLHFEDIIKKADRSFYTKKELNTYQKVVDRLRKNVGGIISLKWPLGAIVVVDVRKEGSAIREAVTMNIPVVAIVDTNGDPSLVDYVIPANDDAPRSIKVIIDYLSDSVKKGQELAAKKKDEEKVTAEKEMAQKIKVAADKKVAADADKLAKKEPVKKAAPKVAVKKTEVSKEKVTAKKVEAKEEPKKAAPKKVAEKPAPKAEVKKAAPKKVAAKAATEDKPKKAAAPKKTTTADKK